MLMTQCQGSYTAGIRKNPGTLSGECKVCGRRFDHADLAGWERVNVPMHSPTLSEATLIADWERLKGNAPK